MVAALYAAMPPVTPRRIDFPSRSFMGDLPSATHVDLPADQHSGARTEFAPRGPRERVCPLTIEPRAGTVMSTRSMCKSMTERTMALSAEPALQPVLEARGINKHFGPVQALRERSISRYTPARLSP